MNFLHYFTPNQILLAFGPLMIRWYGLIIALALLLAVLAASDLLRRQQKLSDSLYDLAFIAALSGIIGARLYDVFIIDWPYFSAEPWRILAVWQGGLAIHGAIIGGALAVFAWCRLKQENFWFWADLIAVVLPLGQSVGRWGNWFNQELFGRPTAGWWGIPIDLAHRPAQYLSERYFQPAFLIESIFDFLLFGALYAFYRKQRLKSGQYLAAYLAGYGLIRFVMEFIRIDQTAQLGDFRWPQLFSLALAAIGLAIYYLRGKMGQK